eukprot:gene5008-902_t
MSACFVHEPQLRTTAQQMLDFTNSRTVDQAVPAGHNLTGVLSNPTGQSSFVRIPTTDPLVLGLRGLT